MVQEGNFSSPLCWLLGMLAISRGGKVAGWQGGRASGASHYQNVDHYQNVGDVIFFSSLFFMCSAL